MPGRLESPHPTPQETKPTWISSLAVKPGMTKGPPESPPQASLPPFVSQAQIMADSGICP
jgi:hypothetical protein